MEKKFVITLLGTLVFGLLIGLSVYMLLRSDLSPQDTPAIIDGQLETGYPPSGYLVSVYSASRTATCGVTFLTRYVAITAAHCVDDAVDVYVGTGTMNPQLNQNPSQGYTVNEVLIHPDYDSAAIENDVAILLLDNGPVLTNYAEIATAQPTCDYYTVAYGRTDASDPTKFGDRKGANTCVTEIDNATSTMIIDFEDAQPCFGDSGSSVYEKNTNKIVGIISSITQTQPTAVCGQTSESNVMMLSAYSEFVDENLDWVPNEVTPSPSATPTTTTTITTTPTVTVTTTTTVTPTVTIDPSNSPTPTLELEPSPTPTIVFIDDPDDLPNTAISDNYFKLLIGLSLLSAGILIAFTISNKLQNE